MVDVYISPPPVSVGDDGRPEGCPVTEIQSDKATAAQGPDSAGNRLAAKRAAKAAKKAATRGSHGATPAPADEVAKSVLDANAWLDAHGRKLAIGLAALVVLGVGALLVSYWQGAQTREAGQALDTAVRTAHGLVLAPEETVPEGVLVPTFGSAKERDEKALAQMREVAKKYEGTRAGAYGALGEASSLLSLGKAEEASAAFEKLRSAQGSEYDDAADEWRSRVLEGAGYALEAQKKYADARVRFEELSKLHGGSYRILGDYHRARMLVAEGNREEAKKTLEALTKAIADKPVDASSPGDQFDFTLNTAQALLVELGGQPAERSMGLGANAGVSQRILDSLRKQLGSQKK